MPPSAAASAAAARMAARRAASLRATFSVRRYAMGNQPRRQQMNYDSGRSNRLPWPHRAPGGIVARKSTDKPNGRTHARIAVALALTVLLAAGAAQGAEPVKIRASWIV